MAAEKQCNSIDGNLVAVDDGYENRFVSGIASGASGHTSSFWIGANQQMTSSWSWTYNTSMSYTNWAFDQPKTDFLCGMIRENDTQWISAACNTDQPFVCEVDPNAPQLGYCPTMTTSDCSNCPCATCPTTTCPQKEGAVCSPGYTLYAGNCICYKVYDRVYAEFLTAVLCQGLCDIGQN